MISLTGVAGEIEAVGYYKDKKNYELLYEDHFPYGKSTM